jgi:hypothetical protein
VTVPVDAGASMCQDPCMEQSQQRELRAWGDALTRTDGERAAMGRAILMLLDRIEELERELADRTVPVSMEEQFRIDDEAPDQVEINMDEEHVYDDYEHDELSVEDTQPISLRDRIKSAVSARRHDDSE